MVIYEQIRFCEIKSNLNPHALSWYAEKEKASLEFNSSNFKPLFILDKGEITFLNKEAEDFILKELEKSSDADEKLIENVKNFKNGESE